MPQLSITKTYLNGNILTQSDLDNALNSISTFLNTTGLDSTNIQTGGLIGTNLANGTITSTQLATGCVTASQLAANSVSSASITPGLALASSAGIPLTVTGSALGGAPVSVTIGSSGNSTTSPSIAIPYPGYIAFGQSPVTIGITSSAGNTANTLIVTGNIFPNGANNAAIVASDTATLKCVNSVGTTSYPLVVSAQPSTFGLMIIRGQVNSGTKTNGEGFTSSKTGTGAATLTWTTPFLDTPMVVCSAISNSGTNGTNAWLGATSNTGANIYTGYYSNSSGASIPADSIFYFMAVGQRGS